MKITTVQAQESGERIDALLARSGYTRSAAARLIAAGQVTREGKSVKKSELTRAGDVFLVAEDDTPPRRAPRRRISRSTLFTRTRISSW